MPTINLGLPLITGNMTADVVRDMNALAEEIDLKSASKQTLEKHLEDYLKHTGYAVATGTANNYAATLNPALSAYAEGVTLRLKINVANTGASTVNVNGLGAKEIKKSSGSSVSAENLKAGSIYTLAYDGTAFILQGEGGEYGTATVGDVIAGKTIGTEEGLKIGTMPNYSGISPGANGIPANGGIYADRFEYDVLLPKSGYYDTASKVHQILTNLISSNIRAGVVIPEIGITGTLTAEQLGAFMAATGTVVANTSNNYTDGSGNNVQLGTVVVNVLNFKPTLIVLYNISDAIYTTIYHPSLAYGTNSTANINVSGLRGIKLMGIASVDATGFVMPVSVQGGTYRYFALKI